MGSLFRKSRRPASQTTPSPTSKGASVAATATRKPGAVRQMNTFTISVSDALERPYPRPKPAPQFEPELEQEPVPEPEPAVEEAPLPDVAEAAELVHQIREALLPQGDFLSIPAEALLAHLPVALRGPAWPGASQTGTCLMVDKDGLLQKLRTGTISYPLGEFLPDMLEGWVADDPTAEVTLDLPTVVKAIPPELLGPAGTTGPAAMQAMKGRDYFAPSASVPVSQEPEDPAEPAAPLRPTTSVTTQAPADSPAVPERQALFGPGTGPKRQVVPVHIPGAWNGCEMPCDASVGAVDINTAGLEDLQALPGIGPKRARMILDDRERRGPFDGIYDLLRIRGVGRKRFKRITGLSLRRCERRDRHEVLNALIGLPADRRPGLTDIARQVAVMLPGVTCSLIAHDGLLLASSEPGVHDTELRMAVVPMLFRRTSRYLDAWAPGASDCVALPLSDPPLLLFAIGRFFLMLELAARDDFKTLMPKAVDIAGELKWLLGPRAMVSSPRARLTGAV